MRRCQSSFSSSASFSHHSVGPAPHSPRTPSTYPFLSGLNPSKLGACCAVLRRVGEESIFLIFPTYSLQSTSLFLSLSIPLLVYPSFSPCSHPSTSCCLSSEAHCLSAAVSANCIDDLLLHLDLSFAL